MLRQWQQVLSALHFESICAGNKHNVEIKKKKKRAGNAQRHEIKKKKVGNAQKHILKLKGFKSIKEAGSTRMICI